MNIGKREWKRSPDRGLFVFGGGTRMSDRQLLAYMIILVVGLLPGLALSTVQYYRGKKDAYEEMECEIQKLIDRYDA